jgi:hypothetical protein
MRKPSNNQILAKVRQLIDKMAVAHEQQSFQTKKKEMSRVMEQIDQFDRSRGPGLKVGRLVSWPQGDGQAFYFVTRVGKSLVRLAWLPWWDSWQSPAVVDGHALRPAVEPAVRSRDGRRKLFGNRSAKAEKPNT